MPHIPEKPITEARLPRPPDPSRVHRIETDAEALEVARRLAAEFAPGASQRDRERILPWEELDRWSHSGLGGITVPREYGGADVTYETLADVFVILCAADPALGQVPQNHFGLLGVLREIGTDEQKRRFYAEVLAGGRLGNAGPERKSATILQGETRLKRTAEGLRLTGRRFYSTGALFAHRVPARAIDDAGRPVQVWVPRDAPGLSVIDDWSSLGQRTTASGSVTFEAVPVDAADVLPVWQLADRPGLYGPNSQLVQAAIDQGIAVAAVADAIAFVREKARPWVDSGVERAADDPHLIQDVGRLQVDLHAAHEVLHEAARRLDAIASAPVTAEASARASVAVAEAKVLTTRIALDASEKLFELAGSSATRAQHNLDRHWRNARTLASHNPTIHKAQAIGDLEINGTPLPDNWFF